MIAELLAGLKDPMKLLDIIMLKQEVWVGLFNVIPISLNNNP